MGNIKVEYTKLYKVLETKENFYLLIGRNQGIIIEKRNCSDKLIQFITDKKLK